ncbi:hypothetical protein [Robiginitalea aurantiaca]|uniref:Lipoprotein n=1 Tax=Robiginitalea aurantiaca TaxID=3056915 RepID=A0ABT7WFW2_9FLAO|nr:hypothetical protein [Robiginitalea aurantiaca]MDM9631806.1 hypothetical protein [Robiginitalea aurantiaca]
MNARKFLYGILTIGILSGAACTAENDGELYESSIKRDKVRKNNDPKSIDRDKVKKTNNPDAIDRDKVKITNRPKSSS